MNDLQNLNLIDLLPASIAGDETIRNICNAIAEKLQTINEKAELVLLLPRLDQLPETLVDELARLLSSDSGALHTEPLRYICYTCPEKYQPTVP